MFLDRAGHSVVSKLLLVQKQPIRWLLLGISRINVYKILYFCYCGLFSIKQLTFSYLMYLMLVQQMAVMELHLACFPVLFIGLRIRYFSHTLKHFNILKPHTYITISGVAIRIIHETNSIFTRVLLRVLEASALLVCNLFCERTTCRTRRLKLEQQFHQGFAAGNVNFLVPVQSAD